jgi:hypothetical protein
MVYGYGPVAFSTFIGFIAGYIVTKEQWAPDIIRIVGIFSLIIGIIAMMTRIQPVIGVPGGLLTGFGLGVDFATTF